MDLTEEEIKHQDELHMASKVLESLGLKVDKEYCFDRPDLVFSLNDKKVGLEVVRYMTNKNVQIENELFNVLKEYAEKYDKENDTKAMIILHFCDCSYPRSLHVKACKEELFKEIDNCISKENYEARIKNKYISNVSVHYFPKLNHSEVTFCTAFFYENAKWNLLDKEIKKKEKKLEEYKMDDEKGITDWWLLVYFPTVNRSEYDIISLPDGFKSTFDRIYLADPFKYKLLYGE